MKARVSGHRHILQLMRGEEVIECLERYAREAGITAASIQGIGAASEITAGAYDFEAGRFNDHTWKGNYEINSILGNISMDQGKAIAHIHLAASDKDGVGAGGHLQRAVISVTAEIFLDAYDAPITREYDAETRRRLWKF
jgi:predicted DNA-binding protein with PD1-like motif